MHLELSVPVDQITLHPPHFDLDSEGEKKNANSVLTDMDNNPVYIRLHTTLNEKIHNASNRAYVDVNLEDTACLDVMKQLTEHVIQSVIKVHSMPNWFGKTLPETCIRDFFESFIECQKSRTHPFLRLKTDYSKHTPRVCVYSVCENDFDNSQNENTNAEAVETVVQNFENLQGKDVCYEIQLEPLRFIKNNFKTGLKLVAVHHVYAKKKDDDLDNIDLTQLILNNDTHKTDQLEEVRAQMKQQRNELSKLELLKEEVEQEVATVMSKQEDVDRRYKEIMAHIQEMEALHSVESDLAFANEDDEIIVPLDGMTDTPMDNLAEETVDIELADDDEGVELFTDEHGEEASPNESEDGSNITAGNATAQII